MNKNTIKQLVIFIASDFFKIALPTFILLLLLELAKPRFVSAYFNLNALLLLLLISGVIYLVGGRK